MADVTKVKASDGTIYDINDVNDYTKDETDALLANKADVGDSYTKAEDDALLAAKAGVGDSYTKAEDDALLGAKADITSVDSALALKANVIDVYSKTEADNLLAGKADTGVSYTKAEDDALLADKANAADVYTITQTDALLADKAGVDDSSITATMATWSASKLAAEFQSKADSNDVYTKAEVDALIGGIKMFPNLDWANPVHTFDTDHRSYTAVEDCYLTGMIQITSGTGLTDGIYINGIRVYGAENYNVSSVIPVTLIKAGVTVEARGGILSWATLHIFKEVTV